MRLPRRGGRGTGRARPARPAARAARRCCGCSALIAIVIAVLVFFGLVLQSCASTSKHDATRATWRRSRRSRTAPTQDGVAVATALTTPGAEGHRSRPEARRDRRAGAPERRRAAAPEPAGAAPRREPADRRGAAAARQRRRRGSPTPSRRTAASKAPGDAALLAAQADRLLASDVVWDDFFSDPVDGRAEGARASAASCRPTRTSSRTSDLITERSMALVLTAAARCVDGRHADRPARHEHRRRRRRCRAARSSPRRPTNTVIGSTDLAFVVTVHDGGDSQEVGIKVTLTIQKTAAGRDRADEEDRGDQPRARTKTVTFSRPRRGAVRAEDERQRRRRAACRARRHRRTTRRRYPVIFSLG